METYCAQIENGVVTSVIVCACADFASKHLGGEWICTGERLVGVGWPVVGGEIISPPVPNDPPPPGWKPPK